MFNTLFGTVETHLPPLPRYFPAQLYGQLAGHELRLEEAGSTVAQVAFGLGGADSVPNEVPRSSEAGGIDTV